MTPTHHTQLRNALLGLAAEISAHHQPQPSTTLWRRAQLRERHRARQRAIARAALPLRLMTAIGIVAASLTAAFILHQSWPTISPAALHTLTTWTAPAVALLIAGAWWLLRSDQSKPTLTPNP